MLAMFWPAGQGRGFDPGRGSSAVSGPDRAAKIGQRLSQASLQVHGRLPCEQLLRLVMSGRRCLGSSTGRGSYLSLLFDSVTASTFRAHSRIVNSVGFPMLTGSCSADFASRMMPSISSLT